MFLEFEFRRVRCRDCNAVKREALDLLSDSPFYTKRFAYYVGRRCREASIKAVAEELHLDWGSVKTLEMQYMKAQLAKARTPHLKRIGIDEISTRKGQTYRIVVSDLDSQRPIWFGGVDRSEASMVQFYAQVPRYAPPERGAGQGTENRIRPPVRERPALHQGAEIHPTFEPREPRHQRPQGAQDTQGGQQAPEHGLPAQGILQPAVGLQERSVGTELL